METLWVPSWGTPCGIAEYTGHLAECLGHVRVSATAPPLSETRLLHVQHEHMLFRGEDLLRRAQAARARRVPVVVTEHTILPEEGSEWEHHADALVGHTAAGAEILRARCPEVEVHHIPHGCPTWFPPRKRERGRVLAAFGFLEPRKGFWAVLDALKQLPDTSLVLYSFPRRDWYVESWERAISGLPVRWVRDFLPSQESARRLAAEADALVYWYDPIEHDSASGAVRVGLASGVPMLVSPTRWFDEMGDAVYRAENLVEGVQRILEDTPLRERTAAAARDYCHANSWARVSEQHRTLWKSLLS